MMVFSDHEEREAGMCDLWDGWPASYPQVLKSANHTIPKVHWYCGASVPLVLKSADHMYYSKVPQYPGASNPQVFKR